MLGAPCPMVAVEGTDWMMVMQLRRGVEVRIVVLAQQGRERCLCIAGEAR